MTTPGSIPTHLPAGVYRHYKGPLYLVLGLAHDANADTLCDVNATKRTQYAMPLGERKCVVYVGLQLDAAHEGPRLAVRTLEDFFMQVCDHRDACSYYGQVCPYPNHRRVARFTYVGPEFQDGMQQ